MSSHRKPIQGSIFQACAEYVEAIRRDQSVNSFRLLVHYQIKDQRCGAIPDLFHPRQDFVVFISLSARRIYSKIYLIQCDASFDSFGLILLRQIYFVAVVRRKSRDKASENTSSAGLRSDPLTSTTSTTPTTKYFTNNSNNNQRFI